MRFEIRENNFDFNSASTARRTPGCSQRFRLGLGFDVNPWLKFYVQGQDVRELGGSRPNDIGTLGAEGDDVFDILKAYVQIGKSKKGLSATIGRQFLSYGDQRLVGPLEWLNQARTFDAVKLPLRRREVVARPLRLQRPVAFTNELLEPVGLLDNRRVAQSDVQRRLPRHALRAHSQHSPPTSTSFNKRDDGNGDFGAPLGDTDFYTFGTLWKGDPKKLGGFDYSMEMAFQTGEVSGQVISPLSPATGASVTTGSSTPGSPASPCNTTTAAATAMLLMATSAPSRTCIRRITCSTATWTPRAG